MNLWVISRQGKISDAIEVFEYSISSDYLTTDKTNFTIHDDKQFNSGDFILAKYQHGGGIAFFGVIDSFENKVMVCNEILTLVNFEFPATRFNGRSFEDHARKLITKYLFQDSNKVLTILDIAVLTNTPHVYQPVDPPTPTNLMKYLINGFKKYNIVWKFEGFDNGRIKTSIRAVKDTKQLKDNINGFLNWDVSTTEVGKGVANHLLIIDKTTNNSEIPGILSQWWLLTDNTVTTLATNPLISKPTRTIVSIYDQTEVDRPTYQEVAEAELKGGFYAHEITVNADRDNMLFEPDKIEIGTLVNITVKGRLYNSVLTGFTIEQNSSYMQLRFGHIRSRLSELLE